MFTEFEVRRRMDLIRASRVGPFRKARMLLRLGKSLSAQMKSLRQEKEQVAQTADQKTIAGLTRMATNTQQLREYVRDAAFEALHPDWPKGPYMS